MAHGEYFLLAFFWWGYYELAHGIHQPVERKKGKCATEETHNNESNLGKYPFGKIVVDKDKKIRSE